MAHVADVGVSAFLGGEAPETLGGHLNFSKRALTLEAMGADIPLKMHGVGRHLLNVADSPEARSVGASGRRTNYCAKRVASDDGVVRSDAFFFTDVTPKTGMRPAGRGGPSLILSRLETRQFAPGGLQPGGEISPSLRLD